MFCSEGQLWLKMIKLLLNEQPLKSWGDHQINSCLYKGTIFAEVLVGAYNRTWLDGHAVVPSEWAYTEPNSATPITQYAVARQGLDDAGNYPYPSLCHKGVSYPWTKRRKDTVISEMVLAITTLPFTCPTFLLFFLQMDPPLYHLLCRCATKFDDISL